MQGRSGALPGEVEKVSRDLIRCRHCEEWNCLTATGWRSQHRCLKCGKLSYRYPTDREDAALMKGKSPFEPGLHPAVADLRARLRAYEQQPVPQPSGHS